MVFLRNKKNNKWKMGTKFAAVTSYSDGENENCTRDKLEPVLVKTNLTLKYAEGLKFMHVIF